MAASASASGRRADETDAGLIGRARSWLPHLAAIAGYAALTLGLFWQLAFLPGTQMPRGGGDLASFLFPLYSFAAKSLKSGVFPLWLPGVFGGAPFAADVQSGVFYPPNLVAFVLAPTFTYATLETLAVVHYVVAATLAYAYGRVLGLSGPAAFAGGIAFGFCGFLVAHFGHYNMLAAAVWLPGSAAALTLALRRGGLRWPALASALFALTLLSGHTQIALFGGLYLGWVWLWECLQAAFVENPARPRAPRRFVPRRLFSWRLAVLPAVFVLAAMASAVLLLPAAELARLSVRSEINYAQASEYSASPLGLITLLVPHFFGDNPGFYWGVPWGLHEVYAYVGAGALVIAALGLVSHRRDPIVWFLALTALGGILLSLADYTVLHGWLYRFVPGFDKVRAAGRFVLLVDLGLAGLVGFGVQTLWDGARRENRPYARVLARATLVLLGLALVVALPLGYRTLINSQDRDPAIYKRIELAVTSVNYSLLFVGVAALALVAHVRRFRPRLVAALAIALVAVDLISANARLNPTTPNALAGFDHPKVVEFLKSDPGRYRVDTATGIYDVWQPDTAALVGLEDVGGLYNPMKLADFHGYWESLGGRSTAAYDLLSAKYVVGRKDVQLDWSKFQPALTDAPDVNVHANAKALPRAFVVPAAEVAPRETILARLRDSAFEPRAVVLVEPGAESHLPAVGSVAKPSEVTGVEYPSPNEIVVRLDGGAGGFLFLSEVYYPGWVARVDGGASQPVLRGNYLFRVVPLGSGAHEVQVTFEPPTLRLGLGMTALGWIIIGGALAFGGRRLSPGSKGGYLS